MPKDTLLCYYQTVRGLRSKVREFHGSIIVRRSQTNSHRMSKITEALRDGIHDVDIYSSTGEKSLDEKLLHPYRHIAQNLKWTNITMITNAYNYWFNVPKEKLTAIEDILEILCNAAFLFDDVEDGSIIRRGSPVAHSIYGAASTLAASNYALSILLEKILDFIQAEGEYIAETTRTISEIFVDLFRGQGQEIYWKEGFICPTEEEYSKMCRSKANIMFSFATCLMCLCSERKDDYSKFNELLAEGFQIANDYANLTSEHSFKRKTFCDDITEGKFSLPIIHAIRSHPEDHQIIDILRLHTTDYKLKQHCLSLIRKYGGLEYTRKRILQIREEVIQEGRRFGNNPPMDTLITFLLGRKE